MLGIVGLAVLLTLCFIIAWNIDRLYKEAATNHDAIFRLQRRLNLNGLKDLED